MGDSIMLPGSMNVASIVGICLLSLGVLLAVVGTVTPAWSEGAEDYHYNVGPFSCEQDAGVQVCESARLSNDDVKAVEALLILALIFGLLGLCVGILMLILMTVEKKLEKGHDYLHHVALLFCLGSFVFLLFGVIVWAATVHDDIKAKDVGYSLILCIISSVFVSLGGVSVHLGGRKAIYMF